MKKTDIKTLTIEEIKRKFEKGEIDFNPSYQRKSGVWRDSKKLLLIDSILSGYIFPVIYFRAKNDNPDRWEVVDGSQRLTVIKEYLIEKKSFDFGKYGIDKYKHYDEKTWEQFINMSLQEMIDCSREGGNDIQRMKEFKLEYVLITSATDDEMTEVFRRLNSGEPLSEGEWLTCLLPSLPLWEITKEFADYCYSHYRYKKNGFVHEDFDPLRNMDAWFWANVALDIYKYEINGELVFSNGKRSMICDEYEKMQNEYSALNPQKQQENKALCLTIKENMIRSLELFEKMCRLMQNDFKRPKALFTTFVFSYMNRDNRILINNLDKRDNTFSKRIRCFSGERIPKQNNEQIIDFTEQIISEYKRNNQNTSRARAERYRYYEKLLTKE